MMKPSAYAFFTVLFASLVGVPLTPAVAQEGADELGAPTQPSEEVAPQPPEPVVAVVEAAPPVVAAAPVLRGSQLTVGGRVYELGCNAGMHFVYGHVIYVQCANAVVVVDTANVQATTFAVAGMPTNFFEQGGRVWVELNHDSAHPVSSLPSLAPQAAPVGPQYPQATHAQRPGAPQLPGNPSLGERGTVMRVESGEIYIEFDNAPELYAGTRVAFVEDGVNSVVGTLTSRAGDFYIARITYGENVSVGAEAVITEAATTGSSSIPERTSSFRLAVTARGLIGGGEDGGGGIIADIDAEWRLRAPVFLRLLMEPLGVGFGDETIGLAGGHFIAGFDSSFLAMGLGIGFQLVEDGFYDDRTWDYVERLGIGTSIGFLLRVGSPEGFHVELFNAMTYIEKFQFGSIRLRAQWGLGHRNWMVIRGGGGFTRTGYGEVGFRRLLSGWSGDEGALFLTASFGGSAIFSNNELYAGPTFGMTIEKIW